MPNSQEEKVILDNLEAMRAFREKVKAESEQALGRVKLVVKGRKINTLETFRAELPVILRTIAQSFTRRHKQDIVKIAKANAVMTEKLI